MDEAKQAYRGAMGGSQINPAMMGSHFDNAMRFVDEGGVLPSDPASEAWKLPSYFEGRQGAGGFDVTQPGGTPALDTHERRRLLQGALDEPGVAKMFKALGVPTGPSDVLPLRNALDYRDVSQLYSDAAQRFGLPTAQAAQAARWTGGFDMTGLQSPPYGDYIQLLEDAVAYSAQQRGMDDSPAALRKYMQRVLQGDEFIVPYAKGGGYPVRPQNR
jgi:hypothetical protein